MADGFSVSVEVEVEEDFEVGVEHEVRLVVVVDGLPLPVRYFVLISGILEPIKQ